MSSTSGTARTTEELMYLFRDGQPSSAITAQDMRDFVASIPEVQSIGDVRAYGAVADGELFFDGIISSTSTTLVSGTANFVGREGQSIFVEGAGVDGADLLTTIVSVNNASSCVISAAAGTTVSAAEIRYGTDNTAYIQEAFDASSELQGARVFFARGRYLTTASLTLRNGLSIEGDGFAYSPWLAVAPAMIMCCANVPVLNSSVTAGSGLTDVSISKITIRGTSRTGSKGIHTARVTGIIVDRCSFYRFGDQAIHMHGGNFTAHFFKCFATDGCLVRTRAAYVGVFDVDATDIFVADCEVTASTGNNLSGEFGDGKIAAFKFSGGNSWVRDCMGHHSQIGFYVSESMTTFVNCRADYCQGHGWVISGSSNNFIGCRSHANVFNATDTYSGFFISGGNNTFHACQVSSHYGEGSGPAYQRYKHAFVTTNSNATAPNQFLLNHVFTDTSGDEYQFDGTNTLQVVVKTLNGTSLSLGQFVVAAGPTPATVKWINESADADEQVWTIGAQTIDDTSQLTGVAFNDAGDEVGQWFIVIRTGTVIDSVLLHATNITLDGILNLKNGSRHLDGTGDPNSVVTGSIGDTYSRRDGGAGTSFYVKESGTGTNTGWVGK